MSTTKVAQRLQRGGNPRGDLGPEHGGTCSMSISNPKRPRGPTKPPLRTIEDNVADEALQDVLDGVEKGLSRLPVDDRYRPPLLQVREGLMLRLGQDPLSEAPAPLAQVLALSPSLRGGESR